MWFWGWLLACGDAVGPERLPGQAPTPDLLGLSAGQAIAGEDVVFTVSGARPGDTVAVFRSRTGPGAGPCPPAGAGMCLDLDAPTSMPPAVVGPTGTATVVVPAPAGANGRIWVQAARLAAPAGTSPVVEVDILGFGEDSDEDVASDAEEALAGTDPFVPDTDGDGAVDGVELLRGMDAFGPDSDADGIPDAEDVLPTTPNPPDLFAPIDTAVSARGVSMPDPEFDPLLQRFVWQEWDGAAVWTAGVDPATGDLAPPDGRGERVDTGVASMGWGRNGPEWVYGPTGVELLYTRFVGAEAMVVRAVGGPGAWSPSVVPGTQGAQSPIGSLDVGDPAPRVRYVVDDGSYSSWFADLSQPGVGGQLPRTLRFARWVPGTRLLTGVSREGGIDQVFTIDVDTSAVEQVTASPFDKGSVFFFEAPELGGELLMFATHALIPDHPDRLVVYRRSGGAWTPIKEIGTPPGFPYVVSPEPFVWGGRTYVSYLATKGQFNFDNGEGQIWLAALAPGDPLNRRVSLPDAVVRKDPEPYTGGTRPWVYYSRVLTGGDRVIRRCELGL